MPEISPKAIKVATGLVVFALLYAVAINYEQNVSSQRYVVTATDKEGAYNRLECLTMEAGITKEMELERDSRMSDINREKMGIFAKWIGCGVL